MTISQSISSFFLPNQRRRRPAGGGGGPKVDPATQRLLEGINGVLEPFNAPDHLTEYLSEDLKKAFEIEGPRRPVYEPGRVVPIKFNLLDLVTDPVTTTWETVKKPFESKFSDLIYTPDNLMSDVDNAVWDHLYKKVWVDAAGGEVIPDSLKATVALWNESKAKGKPKIIREGAARAVRANPGMIAMKSHRLEMHYMAEFGRTSDPKLQVESRRFRALGATAGGFEVKLGGVLNESKDLKKRGDDLARQNKIKEARWFWTEADKGWAEAEQIGKDWDKGYKDVRDEVDGEFKSLSRKGDPLYNSPEAQFSRFWEYRNKHYATLQFLRTYKEDGFWGVTKFYGWKEITNKFKDYYYASRLKDALNSVAEKIGVKKLLGKLADLQTFTKRLRAGFWLKKGMQKVGMWLIKKLGLGAIGATIGSAVPLAGTAIGAVIGAVLQFVAEVVVEKLGGVFKIVGYVLAGAVGFFVLFAIAIVTLISIVLSNEPYPWEAIATEVDCDISATAVASCFPKDLVQQVADNWGLGPGNQVEACYSDVVAKSDEAGVDSGIALATWLHESNASNYELYVRLGEPPQDFGIPSLAGQGFTAQIASFFNLYNSFYPSEFASCYPGHSEMEGFFRAFCTAGREEFGVGQCPNLTDVGENCVQEYLDTYDWIKACR